MPEYKYALSSGPTCALKSGMVGESSQRACTHQASASTLALPHQSPVQLHQQTLMQIACATVHHLAQWHLQIVLILRAWSMQVN